MPLSLFRSRTFAGTNLLTRWLYAALAGAFFFLPFNLIQVRGYSATAAGGALLPFVILMFSLSRWSGGLVDRFGARKPLIVGPAVAACGFVLFAVPGTGGSYWTAFLPAVLVLGLGMAISVAPLTTAVMGAVGESHAGVASGINNAVSRCAGLLAVAVLGLVLLGVFSHGLDRRLAGLNLPPETRTALAAEHTRLANLQAPASASPAVKAQIHTAVGEAFVDGFRRVMLIAAGLAVLASLSSAFLIESKPA